MDIRQSEMYARYMRRIGWVVIDADGTRVFIKRLPLIGSFMKIQRPQRVPSMELINELVKKYRTWSVSLEANSKFKIQSSELKKYKINNSPYLPTKTIQIDLMGSEEEIFQRFAEAKRRAVRRAVKNGVVVKELDDIEAFNKLKSKDFWPLGWFMSKDIRALWESFRPKNASVVIGYYNKKPVACVLLLFHDNSAYYWMAASKNEGKKLFAPTLLVWEVLKLAKKRGCSVFDFEGVYDDRFAKATKKWKGFTKFKQGFGGREILFPKPLIKHYFRITF